MNNGSKSIIIIPGQLVGGYCLFVLDGYHGRIDFLAGETVDGVGKAGDENLWCATGLLQLESLAQHLSLTKLLAACATGLANGI